MLLLPVFLWKRIKPILEREKESNFYRRGLKRIKNNPLTFEGLLTKSRKINTNFGGLGITLKGDSARYDIVKVCNPYCPPCAEAHPILEELVSSGKINLQILFITSNNNTRQVQPVKHLLAIDEIGSENEVIKKALDDWYLAKNKDYEVFAQKYPLNGELTSQSAKVEAMSLWCKQENIKYTPSIFINGYELPREYSIRDLIDIL